MQPTGALPRKDDVIAGAPEKLGIGTHGVEHAAWARGGVPEFGALPGIGISESDGPGCCGGAIGADDKGGGGYTNEGDFFSVGGPDGVGITVDGGI